MAENTSLSVSDIKVNADLQAREGIDENHAADISEVYKKRGKPKIRRPRVMQVTDRDDMLFAIDQHRIVAAILAGRERVDVLKLVGTWQDARDLATASNVEHNALKRSNAAKERAVQMTWEDHPDWTPGRVAKHCAVSNGMAKEWMATVPAAAAVPQERRVGLDGKKRRAPKPSKNGKSARDPADPDRFEPITAALANVSRRINEAMNDEGGEKLLAYLTYYTLVKHPGAKTAIEGDTVTPEPKYKGFPVLGYIVRAAALPGPVRTHEQLKAMIEKWKEEKQSFVPNRS